MTDLLEAFRMVAAPDVLIAILASAIYGLVVGSLPGLSATMATALLVPEAGASLVGTRLDEAALDKAAAAVRAACRPIDDKRGTAEYRTRISSVIFKRAAAMALSRAKA